jgi:DnaJ-class molecular chaperone
MIDPYRVLNVPRDADPATIKAAYRKLAKRLHPDRNPGDAHAEQRFKEISRAYNLLSDPKQRRRFDRGEIDAEGRPRGFAGFGGFGPQSRGGAGPQGAGGFRGFEDILGRMFGGGFGGAFGRGGGPQGAEDLLRRAGSRGAQDPGTADRRYRIEVDFLTAARGGEVRLELAGGRTLKLDVPPGTEDGRVLRLRGQGDPGPSGAPGDALVTVAVRPDPRFTLRGRDIHVELPVGLRDAVLGAKLAVPTIDGPVRITVPAGANSGQTLRLKGKGVAVPDGSRGDQYVRLLVTLPDPPDAELAAFLRRWAAARRAAEDEVERA